MSEQIGVGIIGCGKISGIYLKTIPRFPHLRLVTCADLVPERAQTAAEAHGIRAAGTPAELLADPAVDVVVDLTIPAAHVPVGRQAVEAGKHVYHEKPLGLRVAEADAVVRDAEAAGLRVGCAPDTFLGGGHQTCRKLVDEGAIGQPVGATAFLLCHGHESWHPDPEFYYQPGGGPMFDMGPYYLTAMVNLLGPVRRVAGLARASFEERLITSQPKNGQRIRVEVPTHVLGLLEFASGALGTIVTSFDVWAAQVPRIEIYGSEGTLSVPDPNGFGGAARVWTPKAREWTEVAPSHGYTENSRGLGVADLAAGLASGRPHRASGELARHVLEIMEALHVSAESGQHVELRSRPERPAPMRADLPPWVLD